MTSAAVLHNVRRQPELVHILRSLPSVRTPSLGQAHTRAASSPQGPHLPPECCKICGPMYAPWQSVRQEMREPATQQRCSAV
eukprot:464368-Karenia_brevis.AAC.1